MRWGKFERDTRPIDYLSLGQSPQPQWHLGNCPRLVSLCWQVGFLLGVLHQVSLLASLMLLLNYILRFQIVLAFVLLSLKNSDTFSPSLFCIISLSLCFSLLLSVVLVTHLSRVVLRVFLGCTERVVKFPVLLLLQFYLCFKPVTWFLALLHGI